ncbi:MAG: alpha/beta fold hydrolase [Pseudomonadota bacterium]
MLAVTVTDVHGDNALTQDNAECVVLLHGLARTERSMRKMARALRNEGYAVANLGYPSRSATIDVLAPDAINAGLDVCRKQGATKIHFVTHSMGGILLRHFLANTAIAELGRTVMLAPPNQGSEVVDTLRGTPGFRSLNGPAGLQLGTGDEDIPRTLGAANFDVGIIAGTRSMNLVLSQFLPNPDDGKVSVESAKLDGMADFMTIPVTHPFIMKKPVVIQQTLHFLKTGAFDRPDDDA